MPTEKNKSHIQGIVKKDELNTTLHNLVLFLRRSHFKNECEGFIRSPNARNNKTTRPALAFEIVLESGSASSFLSGLGRRL